MIAAIDSLVARTRIISNLAIEVKVTGKPVALPDMAEENLLQICQEALTNVMRHAKAQKTAVYLSFEPDQLHFMISDDGVGFVPDPCGEREGFGLTSMKARAGRVGGTFSIESSLGTRVKIVVPLDPGSQN